MAQEFSFDVVSNVDIQAVDNAINSANREISTRYDFRGSVSRIEFDKKTEVLTLFSDNEGKLKSVIDVLQSRLVRQGISLKSLDFQKLESAEKSTVRQDAKILQGIASEKAKQIVKTIKEAKLKLTTSIQGDHLRVTSRSKDLLQQVIQLLKKNDFGIDVQFSNFR